MSDLDPRALRNAFGSFMTGVTVVTGRDVEGAAVGFTANSFSSVSLDPPLLLVCPGRFLSSFDSFAGCTRFAVSVLAEGQEDVSNTFASFKGDRFGRTQHTLDAHGIPLIDGAVAHFSCATQQSVEAGDHCVLIGRVDGFARRDGLGLGYANGRYFSLGLERSAVGSAGAQSVCGAIIDVSGQVLLEKTAQGFRPLQVSGAERAHHRAALSHEMSARGLGARLGTAYSVFDDGLTHWTYFLASAETLPPRGALCAVDAQDLAGLTYTTPAIAKMMSRYAIEARVRDFSLYLGDVQHGDTHSLREGR